MALTTGQGRTLRKYTIEKDLAARKSDMILEVGHEMLWGKDPQTLVKAQHQHAQGPARAVQGLWVTDLGDFCRCLVRKRALWGERD